MYGRESQRGKDKVSLHELRLEHFFLAYLEFFTVGLYTELIFKTH